MSYKKKEMLNHQLNFRSSVKSSVQTFIGKSMLRLCHFTVPCGSETRKSKWARSSIFIVICPVPPCRDPVNACPNFNPSHKASNQAFPAEISLKLEWGVDLLAKVTEFLVEYKLKIWVAD